MTCLHEYINPTSAHDRSYGHISKDHSSSGQRHWDVSHSDVVTTWLLNVQKCRGAGWGNGQDGKERILRRGGDERKRSMMKGKRRRKQMKREQ